jgi:hypothetical protein
MNETPFSPEEVAILKSLSNRVLNLVPNLTEFKDCIITGPAVAVLSVSSILSDKDRTFIIFVPDQPTLDKLVDSLWTFYSMQPLSFEHGNKFLNNGSLIKWFTSDFIDIIAKDVLVYRTQYNKNFIISVQDPDDYVDHFKYHPTYCLGGKSFVNRYRLNEAIAYVGKNYK